MITDYELSYVAQHRAQELQQEAYRDRLAREYRRQHPPAPVRAKAARWLRTAADRLAPSETTPSIGPLGSIPTSPPSAN